MKIVLLGGGTGLSSIAYHFANLAKEGRAQFDSLTAIQHPYDDGGHSGLIQQQRGIWPGIGDFRKSILAMAKPWIDDDVYRMCNRRFESDPLKGVSVGNILLAAEMTPLKGIDHGLLKSIRTLMKLLRVPDKFCVLPISQERAVMTACLKDGRTITGESRIGEHYDSGESRIVSISLETASKRLPSLYSGAEHALVNADKIVITSGSPHTSLRPHFSVAGFREAMAKSHATIYMVVNAITKHDEAIGWNSLDFIKMVYEGIDKRIDVVLYHNFSDLRILPPVMMKDIVEKYAEKDFFPVGYREASITMVRHFMSGSFASWVDDGFRHNSEVVKAIFSEGRRVI